LNNPDTSRESVAWLLVGHGTRNVRGLAEFHETVKLVADKANGRKVRHAFLELAEPSIHTAIQDLYDAGFRQVVVVPVLLFAAGHAKRDIPTAVSGAAQACPGLSCRSATHLGCHPKVIELARRRYQAARDQLGGCDTLVLVGRGSQEESATAEMLQFARILTENIAAHAIEVAFVAMAEPRLDAVLARVGEAPQARVVVQPHLLFQGEILDEVQQSVIAASRRYPRKKWLYAEHLGPSPELAEAIVDLARLVDWGYHQ
jgi:sirohydrochlorin cobaltochelatase